MIWSKLFTRNNECHNLFRYICMSVVCKYKAECVSFLHISPYLINKRQSKRNTTKEIVLLFIFLNEQNEQSQAQIIYKPNALLFIRYQSKHTSNTNVDIKFSAHGGFLEDHCLSFFNFIIINNFWNFIHYLLISDIYSISYSSVDWRL
jgi:hypothetical protein